jgi:hypothetical protein
VSGYSNSISMLGVATYSAATASRGFDVGEYENGSLILHLRTLPGAGARVYASWAISADATGPRSGRYCVMRSLATALKATGLSAMSLPSYLMGKWCRVQLTMGATTSSKLGAWVIVRGST